MKTVVFWGLLCVLGLWSGVCGFPVLLLIGRGWAWFPSVWNSGLIAHASLDLSSLIARLFCILSSNVGSYLSTVFSAL